MTDKKEMTTLISPVGAGEGQSIQIPSKNSISTSNAKIKDNLSDWAEYQRLIHKMNDPAYLRTVSMTELYETEFEPQPPLIDGLLYRGTYLFVGSPKVGKSFLMAQLAYHVSMGIPLWNFPVQQTGVLYFALEDDYRRLQKRLFQMFGAEDSKHLHFATQCKTVDGGLEAQIQGFLKEHPDTVLIIIDTLKRVREATASDCSYNSDYDIVSRLKDIADRSKITMLIVHHTRKQKAEDIFDMISGTNGLLGAADGAFLLSKDKRTANEATLDITGRDQQDQRLHLLRDPQRLIWDFQNAETELWKEPPDPLLEQISAVLSSAGNHWDGSPTELCRVLDTELKPNALSLKLNIEADRLLKEYGIAYKSSRGHDGRKITLDRLA